MKLCLMLDNNSLVELYKIYFKDCSITEMYPILHLIIVNESIREYKESKLIKVDRL